jgi:alkylhydroperoxidase family enzyme
LTKGFFSFNSHLFHSTLPDRIRELAIVRTGWLRRGEYEWAQHVRLARAAGVSEAEIAAVSEGPEAELWEPFEAAALRAVDELCEERYISDSTWASLSGDLDRQQLMDLVFTVGGYDLLVMAMNTFGLELDPGLEGFPAGTTT